MEAICNLGCRRKFVVSSLNTDHIGNGIEKTYFICPLCGKQYICFYTNEEIRRIQQDIAKSKNISNTRKLQKINKSKMEELKKRIEEKGVDK